MKQHVPALYGSTPRRAQPRATGSLHHTHLLQHHKLILGSGTLVDLILVPGGKGTGSRLMGLAKGSLYSHWKEACSHLTGRQVGGTISSGQALTL